jgi:GDP-mannose 6-dehydrogenase
MDISIFGLGYAGCVSSTCLARDSHNVIGVDINRVKIEAIRKEKILSLSLAWIQSFGGC